MEEEFDVLGMPYDHRGARADEQLEVFEQLFSQDLPSYDGKYYQFPEIGFRPKPTEGRIPVWVGGSSAAAFRRTARFGDGFHAAFEPLERVKAEWDEIDQACDAIGRDRGEIVLSVRLYLDPEGRMEPEKSITGSTDQMLEEVARWQDIGVTHIGLDAVAGGGASGRLDALRAFMTDVAPNVS
jgi:alkanesulfonate monooxygenase SsuD/methylene tetrahydromethanopterin reductase-like flavin-dependent oxidoreductase (luciferase family)